MILRPNPAAGYGAINRLTLRFSREIEREFAAEYARNSLGVVRLGLLSAAVLTGLVLSALALIDPARDGYWRTPSQNVIAYWSTIPVIMACLASFYFRDGRVARPATTLTMVWYFGVLVQGVVLGSPGVTIYLTFMLLMIQIGFTLSLSRIGFASAAPLSAGFVIVFSTASVLSPAEFDAIQSIIYLTAGTALAIVIGYSIELYARRDFVQRRLLAIERQKVESLLLNILPEAIAERLKLSVETIADSFEDCTVLFADVVGFTQLSARLSPEELVMILNRLFTKWDELAERHGLEKIKTIGDAYMVAGGLPIPDTEHAVAMAEMALDIGESLAAINAENGWALEVRIGMASGPVVAGVIGQRKFAYDLWGDTVNTASRMESQGLPGVIQVTKSVYLRLRNRYAFEPRGAVDVRGKGEMATYFLKGRIGLRTLEPLSHEGEPPYATVSAQDDE